jgi:four helix bundle protein
MTVKRFEELDAWQLGRQLTRSIYSLTRKREFSRDYGLKDQIQRAATSTMTNVAEGFERGGNREFARFVLIARGSSGEVRSLLYVARDNGYINEEEFGAAYSLCVRTSQVLWGLVCMLRRSPERATGRTRYSSDE